MTPDPDRDILVYHFAAIDALTGEAAGDRWSVWAGREHVAAFDAEADALGEARALAEQSGRPAWVVRDGRAVPLAPAGAP